MDVCNTRVTFQTLPCFLSHLPCVHERECVRACVCACLCVCVCVREKDRERKSGCFGTVAFHIFLYRTLFVYHLYLLFIFSYFWFSPLFRHLESWTGLQTLNNVDMELYTGLQRLWVDKRLGFLSYAWCTAAPSAARVKHYFKSNAVVIFLPGPVCRSFSFAIFSFQICLSLLIAIQGRLSWRAFISTHCAVMCYYRTIIKSNLQTIQTRVFSKNVHLRYMWVDTIKGQSWATRHKSAYAQWIWPIRSDHTVWIHCIPTWKQDRGKANSSAGHLDWLFIFYFN